MPRIRSRDVDRRLAMDAKLGVHVISTKRRRPSWDKVVESPPKKKNVWLTTCALVRLAISGAVILIAGFAIFLSYDTKPEAPRGESPVSKASLKGHGPLDILQDATRVIEHYLAATSVEDKVYYARRARVVRPLMERYYQSQPLQAVTPKAVKIVGKMDDLNRNHPLYLAAAVIAKDHVIPLILEEREGCYRVDWESQVGYSPMPIDKFLVKPFGQRMWFRLYATVSDYYNYTYSDAKSYLCIKLDFPGRLEPCYGYLSYDHPQYQAIRSQLGTRKRVPMILNLECEEGRGTNQLLVSSFEQARWFVDQDPDAYAPAWSLAQY